MTETIFTSQQRRWLSALLVLGTTLVAILLTYELARLVSFFGDIILVFFLAWLLSFVLAPLVNAILRFLPRLPRVLVVVIVYAAITGAILAGLLLLAATLTTSIANFLRDAPTLSAAIADLLRPIQARLTDLGFQVDLIAQADLVLANIQQGAVEIVGPLQQLALASVGVVGNLLILVMLSVFMSIDSEKIVRFVYRIVPPAYAEDTRILQAAVARSFAGFLRGQLLLGLTFGLIAAATSFVLGLDYLPVTSVTAGVLQAIPFFGPFVSWAPPVLVALLLRPDALAPTIALMAVGWFVVMNVLQPRILAESVNIHPVVVLGSVLVGAKLAGATGVIFGIPIAAVLSALFFHWFQRTTEHGPVALRAARLVEARTGQPVRVPREPSPAVDADIEEAGGGPPAPATDGGGSR
jgi:predicted PurR-regulated permease PerM